MAVFFFFFFRYGTAGPWLFFFFAMALLGHGCLFFFVVNAIKKKTIKKVKNKPNIEK